jgi:hypothetical protein
MTRNSTSLILALRWSSELEQLVALFLVGCNLIRAGTLPRVHVWFTRNQMKLCTGAFSATWGPDQCQPPNRCELSFSLCFENEERWGSFFNLVRNSLPTGDWTRDLRGTDPSSSPLRCKPVGMSVFNKSTIACVHSWLNNKFNQLWFQRFFLLLHFFYLSSIRAND